MTNKVRQYSAGRKEEKCSALYQQVAIEIIKEFISKSFPKPSEEKSIEPSLISRRLHNTFAIENCSAEYWLESMIVEQRLFKNKLYLSLKRIEFRPSKEYPLPCNNE